MQRCFLFLCLLLASPNLLGKALTGKVIKIADGDTLTILTSNKHKERIRLVEIDAPERHQAFGQQSKQSLANLCFHKIAKINYEARDRYGRILGAVFCNRINANKAQITNGMAWAYVKYVKDKSLFSLENKARENKIGLWQDKNPIPPWEFRRAKKKSSIKRNPH